MSYMKTMAMAGPFLACAAGAGWVNAQSTDAYHTIQVFPVVVDSASFAQRFSFRNPNAATVTIAPGYYPGTGTSQGTAIACPTFDIGADSVATYTSLRTICPGLATGSQFGYLYTHAINASNLPYAAYSRIANPQGNGFSVEAFPAHTFTSADATVIGIRRIAATPGSPAYQTNCFVGNLNDVTPPATPVTTTVDLTLTSSEGSQIGATTSVVLTPGKLTRLLDVFNFVGVPTGDYNDARVGFVESGPGEPGIFAFCTVQDNTSFGADFRIAKRERGLSHFLTYDHFTRTYDVAGQDDHTNRFSLVDSDMPTSYFPAGRPFKILSGGSRHNVHVFYFRHPDWVQCELIDPATGVRALSPYGLEMRMVASDAVTVIAGGDNSTGWGAVYLGDKADRDDGNNTRYTIEVETNAANTGPDLPYMLHCQSGSGHSLGEITEYNVATEHF